VTPTDADGWRTPGGSVGAVVARAGAAAAGRRVVGGTVVGGSVVGGSVVGGAAVVDVVLVVVLVVALWVAAAQRDRVLTTVVVDAPTTAAEHTPETSNAAEAPAMARRTSDRAEPGSDRRRMTESSDEEPMTARYRYEDVAESRDASAAPK